MSHVSTYRLVLAACVASQVGCGRAGQVPATTADAELTQGVEAMLDAWHGAAAASDLDGYFELMSESMVFLGTDACERWSKAEFFAYAEAPFRAGRGWRMAPTRRAVVVHGDLAYFDEDLQAVNLGAARGSGVAVRTSAGWRLVQYNLAITVPNERFDDVRQLLAESSTENP